MYDFELEISGADDVSDIVSALQRAIELLEDGYVEGDLRTPSVDLGHFDLTKNEDDGDRDQDQPGRDRM